jgi:hypothetical protein
MSVSSQSSARAQHELDTLLLGTRVSMALHAENEPYDKTGTKNASKTLRVPRQYATIRARANQAGKGIVR